MATIDALYTRLILDLNRDDMGSGGELEQGKIDAVADAVEFYSDELFWFNRANGSGNTTSSVATIAKPAGIRVVYNCTYLGEDLQKADLLDIQARTETGVPSHWAENSGNIQLWPIPNGTYAIGVYGLSSTGVPTAGNSNYWTTEAYSLILNTAKRILCEGPLRDPDGAQLSGTAEQRVLSGLRTETRRRLGTALKTDMPRLYSTFDIRRGY